MQKSEAWMVKATVPEDPESMPKDYRRDKYLWQTSSDGWFKPKWRYSHPQPTNKLVPGTVYTKTWQNHATAKARATVATRCGFIVEVIDLTTIESLSLEEVNARLAALNEEIKELKARLAKYEPEGE